MAIDVSGLCPLLSVYDMPAARRFYCDVLGFAPVSESPIRDTPEGRFSHWCLLQLGPAQLMLNTAYDEGERPVERDPARERAHRDTMLYFGCDDVDAVWRALTERGLALDPPRDAPYGMRQLPLSDPDGYGLCFQAPVRP